MYGIINKAFEELAVTNFGIEKSDIGLHLHSHGHRPGLASVGTGRRLYEPLFTATGLERADHGTLSLTREFPAAP